MTAEMITAIAIWCGNPELYSKPGGEYEFAVKAKDVNACRKKILGCMTKKSYSTCFTANSSSKLGE